MRRWLWLFGLLALCASKARADEVGGSRSQLMEELAHEALIQFERGAATMRVRRTLHNEGEEHDQALIWIDVPDGAVAVGLRTRGLLHGKAHWLAGELMEAERAARLYEELTGVGGYYPKDPALLSWRTPSLLALQVFPVAPGPGSFVGTAPDVASCMRDLVWRLELPNAFEGIDHRLWTIEVGTT